MSWGAGGLQPPSPPESGKIFFFGQSSNFSGSDQKMKDNILKIINEKYEKYSIGNSKIKCPKSEHFGMRHSFFGRCPYFSGKIDPAPPPKNGPNAYASKVCRKHKICISNNKNWSWDNSKCQ